MLSANNNRVALEDQLLTAISDNSRLGNKDDSDIVKTLQQLQSQPSIARPAIAPEVYGRWRLLYTTNADTASPIQRKAVDASQYQIYQDILTVSEEEQNQQNAVLLVRQVVKFGSDVELLLDCIASNADYPLPPDMTERQNDGKILGLFNILGVSKIGEEAKPDPNRPDARIDFLFDEGKFISKRWNLELPYPVPFRSPLFRDARKGWIDITYLSDRLRIAKGNKGTTFVLLKEN